MTSSPANAADREDLNLLDGQEKAIIFFFSQYILMLLNLYVFRNRKYHINEYYKYR